MPRVTRRAALLLALPLPALAQGTTPFDATLRQAAALPHLRTLIVAQAGNPVVERVFRGPGLDRPANIKSASKTVLATLAGIAIGRGALEGLDQPIGPVLGRAVPPEADPRVRDITLRQLLAMRAGLERTSGGNYGRWVASRDWLRFALARPMEDEPGGRMIYSTGTSHILGAVLARATGRSLHQLARDWLGAPLGIAVPDWPRAPEGLHFGGNEMTVSPRALLAFAECWRNGGRHGERQVVPPEFHGAAWIPQARSAWSGQLYGLGWWIAEAAGQAVYFAWGYGGQMAYVVPGLGLSVVMTSDPEVPRANGQVHTLHELLVEGILPAVAVG
jgi:CubicO group peptidase (beta-lactamase class C family)